jgi:hypothetical protein
MYICITMILNSFPHISQLKEQHPEIFATEESNKRLYFATRLVLHEHATRRWKIRRRDQRRLAAATQSSRFTKPNQEKKQQSEVATQGLAPESNQGVVCDKSLLKRFDTDFGRNLNLITMGRHGLSLFRSSVSNGTIMECPSLPLFHDRTNLRSPI